MTLELPYCNFFTLTNQNPYHVIFCNKENQLKMTESCQKCSEKNTNLNLLVKYLNGTFNLDNTIKKEISIGLSTNIPIIKKKRSVSLDSFIVQKEMK